MKAYRTCFRSRKGRFEWCVSVGKAFAAQTWEELKMVAEKNERMQSFVGTVRQLSEEERVAQVCEARRKYLSDMATLFYTKNYK